MLSVVMLNVIMLNVVMLNVVMLSVVMLNVVMLNVVAPFATASRLHPILIFANKTLRSLRLPRSS